MTSSDDAHGAAKGILPPFLETVAEHAKRTDIRDRKDERYSPSAMLDTCLVAARTDQIERGPRNREVAPWFLALM